MGDEGAAHLDSAFIDEHVVHLEVRLLGLLGSGELDEGVVQGLASLWVADDLAGQHVSKAREDELKVTICGHRVQLAHKYHVVLGGHLSIGQVAHLGLVGRHKVSDRGMAVAARALS